MKNIFIVLLLLGSSFCFAQENTTFILVRHAEKADDGTKNPALTKEGEVRAQQLVELFAEADIMAVYSTNYNRTQMTIAPLAASKGLEVNTYEWKNPKALLNKILEENKGGTVVISGHSNTTPILANFLTGTAKFETFEENDFGNILIITASKVGNGKLLLLRY